MNRFKKLWVTNLFPIQLGWKLHWFSTLHFVITSKKYVLFVFIYLLFIWKNWTFIQQGCVELVKNVNKGMSIYFCTFLFQINVVLLNVLFIKKSWQKCIMVSTKISSTNDFQSENNDDNNDSKRIIIFIHEQQSSILELCLKDHVTLMLKIQL